MKVHLIAAARPNFMKVAPLWHELSRREWCRPVLVHTGQHYDPNMSDTFFRDLRLPRPDFHLEVGSGSHAEQTGRVMMAYEKVVQADRPDVIVVVGDVNSTAAGALVGTKAWIPVVHLEAGLRSGDRRMPEEINRLVTDAIADVLWTPSEDADVNLRAEGVAPERISFVGNIMIDSFVMMREAIEADRTRESLGLAGSPYGVVTLHRPSNVDTAEALGALVRCLVDVAARLPLVFPLHPRTRKQLELFGLLPTLTGCAAIRLTDPLGYIQFMNLVRGAKLVLTDSGGVQEETTFLKIACLTLRENTERPVTVTHGSNRLVTTATVPILVEQVLSGAWTCGAGPALWGRRYRRALRRRSAEALPAACRSLRSPLR